MHHSLALHRAFTWRPVLLASVIASSVFGLSTVWAFPWSSDPSPAAVSSSGGLPNPPGLAGAVHFWEQVFGVWSRNQVALHDDEHLNLIYEVIGPSGGYGGDEPSIGYRKSALRGELQALEDNVRYGVSLSPSQQQLMNKITQAAGQGAVYGASDRLKAQHGMREKFKRGLEISGRYMGPIKQTFREAGLPEDLGYLPHVESSFNAVARSSVGAVGAWQFMPSAGRRFMSVNSAIDERHDPILAAKGAARYLTEAYRRLGDWGLAVTSYNHGMEGMARAKYEVGGGIDNIVAHYHGPSFGFDSRNFYAELLAVRSVVNNASRYFPEGVNYEAPLNYERVKLPYSVSVPQLSSFYSIGSYQLAQMNPAWRSSAVDGAIDLPAYSEVWLPKGTLAQRGPISGYSISLVAQQSWGNPDASKVASAPRYSIPSSTSLAANPYFSRSHTASAPAPRVYAAASSLTRPYTAGASASASSGYWAYPNAGSRTMSVASKPAAATSYVRSTYTQPATVSTASLADNSMPADLASKLDSSPSQLSAEELNAEPGQAAEGPEEPEEESMMANDSEAQEDATESRPARRPAQHRRIARKETVRAEPVAARKPAVTQVASRAEKPAVKPAKPRREGSPAKGRLASRTDTAPKGKVEKADKDRIAKHGARGSQPERRLAEVRGGREVPKTIGRNQLITKKESGRTARDAAVAGKKSAKATSARLVAMNEPKRRTSSTPRIGGRGRR